MLRAGRLRHRVVFESLRAVLDSDGITGEEWSDQFGYPIPCEIVALSGRELVAAQAVQSKVSARLTVRYRPEFRASMRAVHRGSFYNIEAVVPDPNSGKRWLTLLCSTGVNDG